MRFQTIILGYFLIGALMWGGGVIQWDDSGVGGLIIEQNNGNVEANEDTAQSVRESGGAIQEAVNSFAGPLAAIWNFVAKFIGYLFWPITTLQSVNAPPRIVVLLGGGLTMAFIGAFIRLFKGSA